MFKKGGKRPPDPAPTRIDVSWGDAAGRRIRLGSRSNDGATVHSLLDAATDPHEREFLLHAALRGIARAPWIEKLPEKYPDSATAWLIRGAHTIEWAWTARGGEYAATSSGDAEALCLERLEQAEADLLHATRLREGDPTPWSQLVITSYGQRRDFKETCDRFDEGDQQTPWLHLAHLSMLQAACAKWGGTNDTMFLYARDVAARAPTGSPCFDVIPLAHIEKWRDGRKVEPELTLGAYLAGPSVAAEISEAAVKSVEAKNFDDSRSGVIARNAFAFVFEEMGESDRARAQFHRIGPRASEYPWLYQDLNPGLAFARAKQRLSLDDDDD